MEKKSAMQELLDWVNKMPKVPISRDLLVSRILIGMEVEKSNIVEAYQEGHFDSKTVGRFAGNAEHYYNNTFKK